MSCWGRRVLRVVDCVLVRRDDNSEDALGSGTQQLISRPMGERRGNNGSLNTADTRLHAPPSLPNPPPPRFTLTALCKQAGRSILYLASDSTQTQSNSQLAASLVRRVPLWAKRKTVPPPTWNWALWTVSLGRERPAAAPHTASRPFHGQGQKARA